MHSTRKVRWAVVLVTMLLSGMSVFASSDTDDYVPEVTDRVARISFVTGDVQIRRADRQDWEVAVLNLPIVEGDEIATDGNGRFEIQFNSYTHLRVSENAQVKIVALRDEGIALSVPTGTVTLRANEFDPSRSYFEVDAPQTTISVRKSGMYRIEAGVADSLEVLVAATDGGEARVYTPDSGFTVKNGRRATIYIKGAQSGEWETAAAEKYADEFDSWSLERDAIIAKRLRDAYYDKYYDRDIYGAEDLNENGEWIYTRKYGYVWRPYRTAISSYSNWSPYRYGHWRWLPSYGWTWVNDEPWGWATYHHGRWVWYDGGWYWTPYGYQRYSRSWWSPALVVVNVFGGNVCWYPLPYNYGYYNYNAYYYSHYPRHRRNDWNNNSGGSHNGGGGPVGGGATPTPTPAAVGPIRNGRDRVNDPPLGDVPPSGIVTVAASEFGRGKGNFGTPPLSVAQNILSKVPNEQQGTPILPTISDLNGKVSKDIASVRPPRVRVDDNVQTGATPRKTEAPLDQDLQKTRIFGGRTPLQINTSQGEVKVPVDSGSEPPRKTGAVTRPIIKSDENNGPLIKQVPQKDNAPTYTPPVKQNDTPSEPVRTPRYEPPLKPREEPRNEPRQPRFDPPPKREDPPPVYNPPPRNDPPQKHDPPPPKNDPPPKSDPPPSKSEPSKPPMDRKGKDG